MKEDINENFGLGNSLLDTIHILEHELQEMTDYANRLAEGLPVGMLPKDIDNLREANFSLAHENHELHQLVKALRKKLKDQNENTRNTKN